MANAITADCIGFTALDLVRLIVMMPLLRGFGRKMQLFAGPGDRNPSGGALGHRRCCELSITEVEGHGTPGVGLVWGMAEEDDFCMQVMRGDF